MSTKKNINDLLINLKPKVLRFTGSNFPAAVSYTHLTLPTNREV